MFARPYAACYELLNQNKPYKQEVEFVWDWAGKPTRVLDLGCGTAHYWKHFPQGVEVWGVEKSQAMIDLSEHKARILCLDAREIKPMQNFGLVTALFDVVNYIPKHDWWKNIPLLKGGCFIFDVWDKDRIDRDGFRRTFRVFDGVKRIINPQYVGGKKVRLTISVTTRNGLRFHELHEMYLHDFDDILDAAGDDFDLVDMKKSKGWQTWYKLRKR